MHQGIHKIHSSGGEPISLGTLADQEPGGVVKKKKRDVERISERDKAEG